MAIQRTQLVTGTLPFVLRILGEETAVRLLLTLKIGERRFGELHKTVGGSTKTVVSRLRALERDGLVTRTLYAEVPPRAVYALTDKGRELAAIAEGLADWERSWRS